jgi:hypothetical protein
MSQIVYDLSLMHLNVFLHYPVTDLLRYPAA